MLLHFDEEDIEGSKESGSNVHTSDQRNVLKMRENYSEDQISQRAA